jgi:serine/threonine protein kinase
MVHFDKFGKYEIIRKLSRSMTDVYLARDLELERPVVLKIIEHLRDDYTQLVIEAEKRGALLQQQLHDADPRILEIYEYGEQGGCIFVAMEYFEGKTLAEILQAERRLAPKRAARYAAELCSQLRTLHSFACGDDGRKTAVVHGDVKPSNVQIGANDELRLLDFGIAKMITDTHHLTHHNLGSPSYCSPERISKSQVDRHADLWAVGVSLYEMLAGAPPYQGQNTRKLENLIQSRRPPRALPESCPAPLKAIVGRALAGDIARRYPSAEAFESDLRAFMQDQPTAAEQDREAPWDSNATVERHPPEAPVVEAKLSSRPHAKIAVIRGRKLWNELTNVSIALLAGILVGLVIFIPIGYYYRLWAAAGPLRAHRDYAHEQLQSVASDWSLYEDLTGRDRFPESVSPIYSLRETMRMNLLNAAENIIDGFRNSSDAQLSDFDWKKGQECLRHALKLDPGDPKARAELALCNGYLNLEQDDKLPKAAQSIGYFREAQSYLPRSPDPHLGLARVYVYALHNMGEAAGEFHQAQQLGYKLGPREAEEQADGYLFRAEASLTRAKRVPASSKAERAKWLQMARDDMERARKLYEPIAGFSNVSTNLEQLQQDNLEQVKLQTEKVRFTPPRPRSAKRYGSTRRWQ